jgi:hypothetical protein
MFFLHILRSFRLSFFAARRKSTRCVIVWLQAFFSCATCRQVQLIQPFVYTRAYLAIESAAEISGKSSQISSQLIPLNINYTR